MSIAFALNFLRDSSISLQFAVQIISNQISFVHVAATNFRNLTRCGGKSLNVHHYCFVGAGHSSIITSLKAVVSRSGGEKQNMV